MGTYREISVVDFDGNLEEKTVIWCTFSMLCYVK
jgi:hypothetical protein